MTKALPIKALEIARFISSGLGNPWYASNAISDLEGSYIEVFEKAVAEILGAPYVLALSSGTACLHTALLALGIGPSDEVIVSPYTWPQTVSPILFVGAVPVFADIDPVSLTLSPSSVRKSITEKTKAVIVVHIFGEVADLDGLKLFAMPMVCF